ncbi:MAG: MscL family protein [Vicinamibacterales bacterium]
MPRWPRPSDAGAVTLNVGTFINTVVNLVIVGFVIALMVKKHQRGPEARAGAPAAPPPTPEDVLLLREIRDALKK